MLGVLFKEVVYAVLLFWLETWLMTPCTGRALGRASQGGQIDYREAALGAPEQKFALPYIGGVYAGGMV